MSSLEARQGQIATFTESQLSKLTEIGFSFNTLIAAKSIRQLVRDNREGFHDVTSSPLLLDAIPPASQCAVNPDYPAIPNSNGLSPRDQLALLNQFIQDMNASSTSGGLNDVDIVMDHASTYVQLDRALRQQSGKGLFNDSYARTRDHTYAGGFTIVGDWYRDNRKLEVIGWGDDDWRMQTVRVVPVIRPKGVISTSFK